MKRLIHLSDLHFGRDRPQLLEPLVAAVNGIGADLVAISGDLTQRATSEQYRAARRFIDEIDAPVLCVPGNHDTPLHNFPERVLRPWRRYRKYISEELEPQVHHPEMSVIGINSVNNLGWQRGWFSRRAMRKVCRGFANVNPHAFRLVVVHHPLEHLPGERKRLTRGANKAIRELSRCGTDIVLSGHLHSWRADTFATRAADRHVLSVQAGTGLSNRVRGEPNDFNLLLMQDDEVQVERFATDGDSLAFARSDCVRFRKIDGSWRGLQKEDSAIAEREARDV
ncbi:metallophosphoesterase [Sulfitobacter sp. D35]|uniref:metallophosphoesterase family protein n=1 Tax=Sulfitobacter sp. D35 TaxID=3083252 RepID=UPI00296E67D3|nr:metallophosphoesterase [Sulfitobacter sp. D35]MDW4497224.1 metallophosphoesterase [Sulfitobacter sp. D35]